MDKPLWSDDERPWVNAKLNSNSKLGVAARLLDRWGQDWHKEGKDPAAYESAHNDIADMADAITELLVERDKLREELAKCQQAATDLDEAGEWTPVTEYSYDEHLNMGPGKPSKWQRVTVRGRMITLDCGDTGRHAALLPEGMGVCQRASKKGGDTPLARAVQATVDAANRLNDVASNTKGEDNDTST